MTLCSITRKAKTWKIILAGFKIAKRELTDESKSVSSLFMNNEKMLPNCCHKGSQPLKNPVTMGFFGLLKLFPLAELNPFLNFFV